MKVGFRKKQGTANKIAILCYNINEIGNGNNCSRIPLFLINRKIFPRLHCFTPKLLQRGIALNYSVVLWQLIYWYSHCTESRSVMSEVVCVNTVSIEVTNAFRAVRHAERFIVLQKNRLSTCTFQPSQFVTWRHRSKHFIWKFPVTPFSSVVPNLFWYIPPFAHCGTFHSSPIT